MATAHAARCDLQSALMLVLDVRCLRKCPLYMDTANAQHHSSTGMIVMLHVRTLSKRESMKHVHETSEACMLPMEAAPAACRGSCRWNMSSQRPDRSAGKRKTRIVSTEQPLRQKISQHCLTTLSLPSVVTAASSHNVRTKSCRSWCLEKCPPTPPQLTCSFIQVCRGSCGHTGRHLWLRAGGQFAQTQPACLVGECSAYTPRVARPVPRKS